MARKRTAPKTPTAAPKSLAEAAQRIVSSSHLVSEKSPELSEFEFGLIIAGHAFDRWMIRCMAAAGVKDMTPTDVLVLHHVNHRGTEKRTADICFVLNIEVPGHLHVRDDQRRLVLLREVQRHLGARGDSGGVTLFGEQNGDDVPNAVVIVDDQDAWRDRGQGFHETTKCSRGFSQAPPFREGAVQPANRA